VIFIITSHVSVLLITEVITVANNDMHFLSNCCLLNAVIFHNIFIACFIVFVFNHKYRQNSSFLIKRNVSYLSVVENTLRLMSDYL
jgi:hypothetical protein